MGYKDVKLDVYFSIVQSNMLEYVKHTICINEFFFRIFCAMHSFVRKLEIVMNYLGFQVVALTQIKNNEKLKLTIQKKKKRWWIDNLLEIYKKSR